MTDAIIRSTPNAGRRRGSCWRETMASALSIERGVLLVEDASRSASVWAPDLEELEAVVRARGAEQGSSIERLRAAQFEDRVREASPEALIIVASDWLDPAWTTAAWPALTAAAERGRLLILHLAPQRLWPLTALRGSSLRRTTVGEPGPPLEPSGAARRASVVTLEPRYLRSWAEGHAGGEGDFRLSIALLRPTSPVLPPCGAERARLFLRRASTEAVRLGRALAISEEAASRPVRILSDLMPACSPAPLTEVFAYGLLAETDRGLEVPGPAAAVLNASRTATETTYALRRLTDLLAHEHGEPSGLEAALANPWGEAPVRIARWARELASAASSELARFGPAERHLADRLERALRLDEQTGDRGRKEGERP